VQRELKFKNLQDDLSLLHKNFQLEQELHTSELENRKLQMWILEDKQDLMKKEVQDSLTKKEEMKAMVEESKLNIENIKNEILSKN